jgi:hypothetical protein
MDAQTFDSGTCFSDIVSQFHLHSITKKLIMQRIRFTEVRLNYGVGHIFSRPVYYTTLQLHFLSLTAKNLCKIC